MSFSGVHWSRMPNRDEIGARIAASKIGSVLTTEHKERISKAMAGRTPRNIAQLNQLAAAKIGSAQWLTCKGCGITFQTKPPNHKRSSYCTRACWLHALPFLCRGQKRPHQGGANSPNWKGGITPANKAIRASPEYAEWRDLVFKRDHFACQKCAVVGGRLHAHHVKSFAAHPELRFAVENGLTLCNRCHRSEHATRKRVA